MAVPEFILRKLYVQGSLKTQADGFSFALRNTFAPATVTHLGLEVDGKPVPSEALSIQAKQVSPKQVSPKQVSPGDSEAIAASAITPQTPSAFSVGVDYTIQARGVALGKGQLRLTVDTVEAGELQFSLRLKSEPGKQSQAAAWPKPGPLAFLRRPLQAQASFDLDDRLGEINPYVYGHFIEHLERCIYGGLWTEDGAHLRPDTLALVKALRPPLMRYPGGNFASGYHWEDGIGPRESRPPRFDQAWNAPESNQVGTDEYMALCREVGADPFLVVNDGSGTPEEAARWVAYCNDPADTEQGRRRSANGHPEPYGVRIWGVGNEVWGPWQIGHSGPEDYAARLRQFVAAMRQADPSIRIVAVGDKVLSNDPQDPGRLWNEIVLRQAGDLIDDLSFHLYQPEREGWLERYDLQALHYTVCAAPLDVEAVIQRMAAQIAALAPGRQDGGRKIGIAFDEWNLWLAPPEGAGSMHQLNYNLRDALYAAGMFHAFHRQCQHLSMANLAQLVNVLPAIVTDQQRAYATGLYFPFWMYQHMQPLALRVRVEGPTFDSQSLGNIAPQRGAPYLDVSATRSQDGSRLAIGVINRHPERKARLRVSWGGRGRYQPVQAWQLSGPDPLACNTFDAPDVLRVQPVEPPGLSGEGFQAVFPACSVTVLVYGANG